MVTLNQSGKEFFFEIRDAPDSIPFLVVYSLRHQDSAAASQAFSPQAAHS
jgi:hypothetical protein